VTPDRASAWRRRRARGVDRLVEGLSRSLGGGTWSRRSFLSRAAVVGSALAIRPVEYALRPGTAYDAVCGTLAGCGDPFTAFCCTINNGVNLCPEGTFVGGWWKADRSAYCRGAARYYVDCNGTTRSRWQCHCPDDHTCDRRKVACNVFRYGNCNLQIANFSTAVVCRVVTCTPPWEWDATCTETAFVDQATGSQSAPCLPRPWPSPILMKWSDLGGAGSPLGAQVSRTASLPDGDGTWARFEHGAIYDVHWAGLYGVVDPVWPAVATRVGREGIGYPAHDVIALQGGIGWAQPFVNRAGTRQGVDAEAVGRRGLGTYVVTGAVLAKWHGLGGVDGPMGYPTSDTAPTGDGLGTYGEFRKVGRGVRSSEGAIFAHPVIGAHAMRGPIFEKWSALGGQASPLGLPASDQLGLGSPRAYLNEFATVVSGRVTSHGAVVTSDLGTWAVWSWVFSEWVAQGMQHGRLGVPTADVHPTPDGLGQFAPFSPLAGATETTGGGIITSGQGTWAVLGSLFAVWRADEAGPRVLGVPSGPEVDSTVGGVALRSQPFLRGSVYSSQVGQGCVLYGPILAAYLGDGGPPGSLGLPTSSVVTEPDGDEVATFQHGTLTYVPGGGVTRT